MRARCFTWSPGELRQSAVTELRHHLRTRNSHAAAAEHEQARRGGSDQREYTGAEKDACWRQAEGKQIATQQWREDAAQSPDTECPAETAGAHASRIQLATGAIGAGLTAYDRHSRQEGHQQKQRI